MWDSALGQTGAMRHVKRMEKSNTWTVELAASVVDGLEGGSNCRQSEGQIVLLLEFRGCKQ
jgi:hypothetical protein